MGLPGIYLRPISKEVLAILIRQMILKLQLWYLYFQALAS